MSNLTIFNLKNQKKFNSPIYILGSFESFHWGHYALYEKAKELNKNKDHDIVLVYFKDIENLYKTQQKIFSDLNSRLQVFANLGFKYALELEFQKIKDMQADLFLKNLIKDQQNFQFVFGNDFMFGYKKHGNEELLINLFGKENVHVVQTLKINKNIKISTSFIKELINTGEIELANNYLVYPYAVNAIMYTNNKIVINEKVIDFLPALYLVEITLNSYIYYALLSIDSLQNKKVEILDFELKSSEKTNVNIRFLKKVKNYVEGEKVEISDLDKQNIKMILLK